MGAVLPPLATTAAAAAARSEGVWRAAWRRLRHDKVGVVSLGVVLVFVLMIVLTATGLVAGGWQKEVGVPSAPPTFMGPAKAVEGQGIGAPGGPPIDISDVDPLAPRYKEWAERASKYKTVEAP